MQRRKFLLAAASVLVAPNVLGQSQPRRVGFLAQIARPEMLEKHFFGAVPTRLRELGYMEGKNLQIDWRFADSNMERLPEIAASLVAARPEVIFAAGTIASIAIKKATAQIPIVFANVSDPVANGLVDSLARPGGNMTGMANLSGELAAKAFELLREAIPQATRIGVLINPRAPQHKFVQASLGAVITKSNIRIQFSEVGSAEEIERAIAAFAKERMQALLIPQDGLFIQQRRQIIELAIKNRIPAVSSEGEFARAGGLMSYGANQFEMFLRAANYVERILKGAHPRDLPVEQPTRFEMVMNAKTAALLGLKVPQAVMLRADRVIE